ncbi:MAG: M36 family metallopeptidase [Chitinophagaceae bacterium]|nr:M36 family metallopeptidase [Chitinophagaceae bacterium]
MKKILLFLMTFWCAIVSMAQQFDVEKNAALQLVSAQRTAIGLSADDLNNLMVTYSYVDKTIGVRYIYLQQTYRDIPVYNKTQAIAYKNNVLASVAGTRIANIENKVNNISGMPAKTAESAVMTALAAKGFSPAGSFAPISTKEMGRKVEFGNLGVSRENVTAQLMWFPSDNENSFKLGWFVYYIPTTTSDYWEIFVDATNGSILGENNLKVSCNWDDPNHVHEFGENHNHVAATGGNPFDFSRVTRFENGTTSPSLVGNASYRVVPIPYEAPTFMPGTFPGTAPGNSTVVNNPWTNVPASFANAITKNWHTDASNTDYNYTRGNNAWAYHDRSNNNSGDPARSATSTTALPTLTFSAFGNAPDYTADPVTGGGTTGSMANNQSFNVTNLFYMNNILHDVLYTHGFDEVARNFQSDNFGRGGNGNDHVKAEAQDGSGSNNANFATPGDGASGTMQMYLWTLSSPTRDGDVDNGIIAHEFGHGVSNRLMGSSTSQTGCVASGEHQGEGISDYIALMFTQDWAAANVNTGLVGRGIGTFALNQPTTGAGIRSQKYSTDLAINNKKYQASLPTQVHDRGEFWCAAAWEATWAIIQQAGTISPTIYYNSAGGGNGNTGNIAAMRIAMQAMKLVPCGAGFLDHRDGWLRADTLLYGGQYSCAIWRAFAKRGMGFFALQGSNNSAGDQTPDETPKSQVNMTTGVASIPAGQNMTYTNTASTCSGSAITGYVMRTTLPANVTFVSATNGGTHSAGVITWPVSMAATGTFTADFTVTVNAGAFPGNVVTTTCLLDNTARTFNCKTITTPISPILAGCPTVSTQPANVLTCAGSSVNFAVVANASNTISYQWQVLVGSTWTDLTNTAPYSNVTTATMTINPTAVGLNGNQYRCFMTTVDCTGGINSNPATLTVVAASVGGTIAPASTNVCGVTNSTPLTLSGHTGTVVRWESAPAVGGPWTAIAATAGLTTYTSTNITATTFYRAVVQVSGGCAAVNSATAVVNFLASAPMIIAADPNTPICAGDPTRLTASEGFGVQTVCATGAITIPSSGPATPYGATLTVSGFPTSGITVKSVTLNDISHTWSSDLDIALTSPTGTAVMLLSDVGGSADFINNTMIFDDAAAGVYTIPPAANGTATVKPTNAAGPDAFPAPGPASVPANPTLATFTGNFNGDWKLWINDQAAGDQGGVSGGYCITFTGSVTTPITGGTFTWTPSTGLNSTNTNPVAASPAVTTTYTVSHNNGVGCTRIASYTVVVNQRPLVATQPSPITVCSGSAATFSITATGAGPLTYQWQVAASATGPWANITAGAPYSGETTATLTINPASALLNNNWYRCTVGGLCAPVAGSTSQPAKLSVNPLPTATINPVGPVCGGIAGVNGTQLSFALTAPPVPGSQTFTSGTINVAIPEGAFPTRPATAASNVIAVSGIPANATITGISARINATHAYVNDIVAVLKSPTGAVINLDALGGYQNNAGVNYLNTTFSSAGVNSISGGTAPFTGTWKADLAGATFTAFGLHYPVVL